MSSDKLRQLAARYRTLAAECVYPEAVSLFVLMADVHEEEADRRSRPDPLEAEPEILA